MPRSSLLRAIVAGFAFGLSAVAPAFAEAPRPGAPEAARPADALTLVMLEEDGCFWCAKWDEEIASIYPKTSEGRTAPLVRRDIHGDVDDLALARRANFTPTFVLVRDGRELSRLEGYPGEDFFWPVIAKMIADAETDAAAAVAD